MALSDKLGIQPELRDLLSDTNIDNLALPMAAEADLAGGDSTTGELHAKVNALLAKLRTAGLLGT